MPSGSDVILVIVVITALAFAFTNGFHDTANAIATSISTRALSPRQAIILAAVLNLVGAVLTIEVFGSKVANTIDSLLVGPTVTIIIAALTGAIGWNLLTWYVGLPSSSTHAFIGGLMGAGVAAAGLAGVAWASLGKVIVGLVLSPPMGFAVGAVFMVLLYWVVHRGRPARLNRSFRSLQVLTSAFIAYSHGGNDAQKSMAAMSMALLVTGHMASFHVPMWIVLLAGLAIGLGTATGGWRIIRTVGWRIYKLEPATGMGAQLVGASLIQVASATGLPVSTTHVLTGAVIGAGAPRGLPVAGWGLGATMVAAWLITIPCAAALAWVVFAILHTAHLG
jgi:inorganic phosphate transporter, PiT family